MPTRNKLIYASSMVMLDSARRKVPFPALALWLLGLGIVATLAANVAHGLGQGLIGAAVGAWSAVALVGSYELLMMIIRSEQVPAVLSGICEDGLAADPLGERAAVVFAADLAADRLPSVPHFMSASRAQRLRGYLAAAGSRRRADPLGPHGPVTGAVAP